MPLDSFQLEAFLEVTRCGSFSKAAKSLHLSQPALSHRIRKLEESLTATLLVRAGQRIDLTPTGQRLLLYCRTRDAHERNFLDQLNLAGTGKLSGALRIAAYSSVARTLLMPTLSPLLTENPSVQLELLIRELRELPETLRKMQVDLVLSTQPIALPGVSSELIGYEIYRLAKARGKKVPNRIYDHDSDDSTTMDFWRIQRSRKPPRSFERAFIDDIHAIRDAVVLGWGQAVLPLHLIDGDRRIAVDQKGEALKVPVHLSYYDQPHSPPLLNRAIQVIREQLARRLVTS